MPLVSFFITTSSVSWIFSVSCIFGMSFCRKIDGGIFVLCSTASEGGRSTAAIVASSVMQSHVEPPIPERDLFKHFQRFGRAHLRINQALNMLKSTTTIRKKMVWNFWTLIWHHPFTMNGLQSARLEIWLIFLKNFPQDVENGGWWKAIGGIIGNSGAL